MMDYLTPGACIICTAGYWAYDNGQPVIGPAPRAGKVYIVAGQCPNGHVILAEFPHECWPTEAFAPVPPYEMLQFRRLLSGNAPITENETFIRGKVC